MVCANQKQISKKPDNSFKAAQILLHNNRVNSAVCVMTAADILQFGLPTGKFESIVRRETATLTDSEKQSLDHACKMAAYHCENEIKRELCNS